MALEKNKNPMTNDSSIFQATAYNYEHDSSHDLEHPKNVYQDQDQSPEKSLGFARNFKIGNSSSVSSPSSCTNSNGLLGYNQNTAYKSLSEEGCSSLINFKPEYGNFVDSNGSLLNFEQFGWLNDQEGNIITTNGIDQELGRLEERNINNKRPSNGESVQAAKKQCGVASSSGLKKCASPTKDPQGIAAKNRRERISERLKILQDLVPNGSKVDLVTMLEKAIGYVKFLQLQVKVLATDELWPAAGGKAPDLSQVKEAIDDIIASQRNTQSTPPQNDH